MPTEPETVTVAQVVHRAAEVVDPDGADDDVIEFLRRFEDADEPVTAIQDFDTRMAEATGALDPQEDAPVLQVARAVAVYLAFRRDEVDDDPDDILRLAVRAEYDGKPPANVANWLDEVGVEY
jgi:putative intracellular protease/amidase